MSGRWLRGSVFFEWTIVHNDWCATSSSDSRSKQANAFNLRKLLSWIARIIFLINRNHVKSDTHWRHSITLLVLQNCLEELKWGHFFLLIHLIWSLSKPGHLPARGYPLDQPCPWINWIANPDQGQRALVNRTRKPESVWIGSASVL